MTAKHRAKMAAGLVAVAFLLALFLGKNAAMALFDESKAVHITPSTIEDGTLLIGTHLIYLHSLNEEIYEIAVQSASDSGQDRRYYKSELAGGMWMDITDAGSISDISAGGTAADENEIRSLYLTHHTKSDGITYDLRTQQPICIFDITSVYDLESLPELEALKMQYDIMQESKSRTKTDKRNIRLVRNFFATNTQTDETQQCDRQLQALQGYYNELSANGADSKYLEMTLAVMDKVSNARKVHVFTIIDGALEQLQNDVADADDMEINDTLLSAIGDSQYALSESMTEAQGDMLSAQDAVVPQKEYELCMSMISNAESSNYYGCDEQNLQLQYLDNINNDRIVDAAGELNLLSELTDSADIRYGVALSAGTTTEYEMLVSQNVSHAARENRMKADIAEANAVRGELEFLIQGTVNRRESIPDMAGKETQEYILMRIQDAAKFKSVVKQDDYSEQYQNSVSEYVQWLNSLLSSIKQTGGSQEEGESLYEQKADLQEQKLKALDTLDLDTAKRIDAKIADIDEQITALENVQSEKLEDLMSKKSELEKQLSQNPQDMELQVEISRLEAELAAGVASVSDGSQAANILESKNEVLELLAAGDTSAAAMERIADNVALLTSMLEDGSPLALEAMKEVYQKMLAKSQLEDVRIYENLQEEIENAISESIVTAGLPGEISPDSAGNVIADVLGTDSLLDADGSISSESLQEAMEEVPKEDVMAALLALGDFNAETGADNLMESFAQGFADAAEQNPDLPVFQTLVQKSETYVPVKLLADYLGYRYIWNETRKNAVLSKGKAYYSFTAYDINVTTEKEDEILSMEKPAGFSKQLFIPGSFVQKQFGCFVYDISGTNCSVLVDDKVVEKSQDIFSELLEKGGY